MSFVYAYLIIGVIFTISHFLEDEEDFDITDVILILLIIVYPIVYYNMWKEGSLWNNKI